MAKSLGQIHTVNFQSDIRNATDKDILDLSGELSRQLQHHVRQGNYFKICGIDLNFTELGGSGGGGQISGFLNYMSPTRGRCAAYRNAFAAMRNAMKNQGISMSTNSAYDFRVNMSSVTGGYVNPLKNVASLDGQNELCLIDAASTEADVFRVHNASLDPLQQGTPTFQTGFNTLGVQLSPTDFVLNDGDLGYTGNAMFADGVKERIPFQASFTPGTTDLSVSLQWRPDPALFIAMMTGLIEVEIDELEFDGGASAGKLTIAVHVAGWKSIMGNPDKKRRRTTTRKQSATTVTTTKTTKKS